MTYNESYSKIKYELGKKKLDEIVNKQCLYDAAPELLEALINLQNEIHKIYKMNVKRDFDLMLADAQASKAIYKAKEGDR